MFKLPWLFLWAELALRTQSFRTILDGLHQRAERARPYRTAVDAAHLARLVEIVDDRHPLGSSCLRRAFVLAWALGNYGIITDVQLGVAKQRDQLRAHAWLNLPGSHPQRFFHDPDFLGLAGERG